MTVNQLQLVVFTILVDRTVREAVKALQAELSIKSTVIVKEKEAKEPCYNPF